MEKLKSYNQLYESSRPGKKADTSNWPSESSIEDEIDIKPIPNQVMSLSDNIEQEEKKEEAKPNYSDDFNNLTVPSGIEPSSDTPNNENEEMIKNFLNQYKNDTLATPNIQYNNEIKNDTSDVVTPVNHFIEEEKPKTSFGTEFIGNYSNPNYDRDQFIKLTTGIEIQEDVDHRGKIFLRVIEPTGREVIYSGKEAVRMIENYNQTYLSANPDKKVDTSLIDNFKEE